MPAREVTLSSKHQIVVPLDARKALGLKPGDKLLVVTLGDRVMLMQKPSSHPDATKGLGRGLFPRDYLDTERESWTD